MRAVPIPCPRNSGSREMESSGISGPAKPYPGFSSGKYRVQTAPANCFPESSATKQRSPALPKASI